MNTCMHLPAPRVTPAPVIRILCGLVMLLSAHVCAARCLLTEAELAGAWRQAGDGGFFEEMEFARRPHAHEFNSWLHQRPDLMEATWSLQHCLIRVTPRDGSNAMRFDAAIVHGRLLLREHGDEGWTRYARIRD